MSYLIALVPNVFINNIEIDKEAAELIKIPHSMDVASANGIVNSAMLDLTVRLARQRNGQLTNIVSQMSMNRVASQKSIPVSPFSRDEYDRTHDNSFLVTDDMAQQEGTLMDLAHPVIKNSQMKRVASKVLRGSKVNLAFRSGEFAVINREDEHQITISFGGPENAQGRPKK